MGFCNRDMLHLVNSLSSVTYHLIGRVLKMLQWRRTAREQYTDVCLVQPRASVREACKVHRITFVDKNNCAVCLSGQIILERLPYWCYIDFYQILHGFYDFYVTWTKELFPKMNINTSCHSVECHLWCYIVVNSNVFCSWLLISSVIL